MTHHDDKPVGRRFGRGFCIVALLAVATTAHAVLWYPVTNDDTAIVSLNQETVVVKGRTLAAEFQYVFKRTLTEAYADDTRADTFRRMKTWVEVDCSTAALRVLERTLIGEKGDRVAEGVPTALRTPRGGGQLDAIETAMVKVACGGVQAAD